MTGTSPISIHTAQRLQDGDAEFRAARAARYHPRRPARGDRESVRRALCDGRQDRGTSEAELRRRAAPTGARSRVWSHPAAPRRPLGVEESRERCGEVGTQGEVQRSLVGVRKAYREEQKGNPEDGNLVEGLAYLEGKA